MSESHESMQFDILIIGAGPSGLATAIRLAQLSKQHQLNLEICVLEKGSEVGSHILSGAVIETKALDELLPNWKLDGAPLHTPGPKRSFSIFNRKKIFPLTNSSSNEKPW